VGRWRRRDVVRKQWYLVVLLGVTVNHTVYGRVPALQNVAVGSYSDNITVTLTF